MVIGYGQEKGTLGEKQVQDIMSQAFSKMDLTGKRVLILIPDRTRTAPIPMFFKLFYKLIGKQVAALDYLIALGTHPPLNEEGIHALVGVPLGERRRKYPKVRIYNHRWDLPETLVNIGTITKAETNEITGRLLAADVPVSLNKLILEYDHLFICGPTFPHEVVGFSGGYKYIFPGIAGAEIINFFHWLGAVITSPKIIGYKDTPVREVLNKAASFVKTPALCLSFVVKENGLAGLYIGDPKEAFSKAADLSAKLHITYVDKPFKRVLSMAAPIYDDIWTAAKAMYKLEPAIEDGGEVIIYAPHITEVSYTHGQILDQIGYHVRDYFLKQMDRFRDIPGGVMAHSTHLKGIGTFENGVERPRIQVTLATGIPEERVRRLNLGYMDPATVRPEEWEGREDEGVVVIHKAGEMLYRLKGDE